MPSIAVWFGKLLREEGLNCSVIFAKVQVSPLLRLWIPSSFFLNIYCFPAFCSFGYDCVLIEEGSTWLPSLLVDAITDAAHCHLQIVPEEFLLLCVRAHGLKNARFLIAPRAVSSLQRMPRNVK